MAFRIEVRRTRSPLWAWFVRQAKEYPGYSAGADDVHVVDGLTFDEAVKFWELTGEWRGIAIYKDGQGISVRRFRQLAWSAEWNRTQPADQVGVCPRCSAGHRGGAERCPGCGFDLRPIDGEVVR